MTDSNSYLPFPSNLSMQPAASGDAFPQATGDLAGLAAAESSGRSVQDWVFRDASIAACIMHFDGEILQSNTFFHQLIGTEAVDSHGRFLRIRQPDLTSTLGSASSAGVPAGMMSGDATAMNLLDHLPVRRVHEVVSLVVQLVQNKLHSGELFIEILGLDGSQVHVRLTMCMLRPRNRANTAAQPLSASMDSQALPDERFESAGTAAQSMVSNSYSTTRWSEQNSTNDQASYTEPVAVPSNPLLIRDQFILVLLVPI